MYLCLMHWVRLGFLEFAVVATRPAAGNASVGLRAVRNVSFSWDSSSRVFWHYFRVSGFREELGLRGSEIRYGEVPLKVTVDRCYSLFQVVDEQHLRCFFFASLFSFRRLVCSGERKLIY